MGDTGIILDTFAGPGGWSEAARMLGLAEVGIELDPAACATRAAAGHRTIRADVARFPVASLAGQVTGFVSSPVCVTFSMAGGRAGNLILAELAAAVRDQFAGRHTLTAHRRAMARVLAAANWPPEKLRPSRHNRAYLTPGRLTRAQRSAAIRKAVLSASLVVEPARYIAACDPEWVALEQVPAVLPLWQVYAAELRKAGYHAWCGKLNSADYGVPQTRERAILIASRVRKVYRPAATHYDPRKGMQLFGQPWVSMAEALGWGTTGRAAPTVTGGGTAAGGAEPFGHRDRDALLSARDNGHWLLRRHSGPGFAAGNAARSLDQPAPSITAGAGNGRDMEWVLNTNLSQDGSGIRQTRDPRAAPAPALTAKSGGQWVVKGFRNNNNNNACERSLDEPAGTVFFSNRSNWAAWTLERLATTVQGVPRIGRPGHKDRDAGGEPQFAVDSVRITVQEAAILQSFPPDYPWQGTRTAQFRQVGDACPPGLALPVLAMAAGIPLEAP